MKDDDIIRALQEKLGVRERDVLNKPVRLVMEEHTSDKNHFFRVTKINELKRNVYPTPEIDKLIVALKSCGGIKDVETYISQVRSIAPAIYECSNSELKESRIIQLDNLTKQFMVADTKIAPFIVESLKAFLNVLIKEL